MSSRYPTDKEKTLSERAKARRAVVSEITEILSRHFADSSEVYQAQITIGVASYEVSNKVVEIEE